MKKLLLFAFGAILAAGASAQDPVMRTLPFSPARVAGDTVYLSGSIARTADGQEVRDSVAAETHQVMRNLGRVLAENGLDFEDIVSATVYLQDIGDYQEMNKAYASYFKQGVFPARACIGGVEIVLGFRVEISCIAYRGKKPGSSEQ